MTESEQAAALAVLLGQTVAYLSGKVDANDLDILSFSLHHLFCDFDSLYCVLLPPFAGSLATESGGTKDARCEQLQPRTWMQLQAVRQVVRRVLPLCQLLSEAGESILGQLGYDQGYRESQENWGSRGDEGNEEGRAGEADTSRGTYADGRLASMDAQESRERMAMESEQDILYGAISEGVEQALYDLAANLICWQQHYSDLPSFRSLLYALFPTVPLPLQPDTPFTQLLAYGCTLFGDILPAFHALAPGDEEAVIMLLFDLLQQIDLLAMTCETLLQLFAVLLQYSMKN